MVWLVKCLNLYLYLDKVVIKSSFLYKTTIYVNQIDLTDCFIDYLINKDVLPCSKIIIIPKTYFL